MQVLKEYSPLCRMKKHGNVEKAEDKTPKKRKKADESSEVKKADEAQAAWDGVKKAKKAETEEAATEEVVEESTDKGDHIIYLY